MFIIIIKHVEEDVPGCLGLVSLVLHCFDALGLPGQRRAHRVEVETPELLVEVLLGAQGQRLLLGLHEADGRAGDPEHLVNKSLEEAHGEVN